MFGQLCSRLQADQRGNTMLLVAATLPLILGAAAFSVDTIQTSLARRQLQRTADSAAMAGAYALFQNQPPSSSVTHDLSFNTDVSLTGSPVVENAPSTGPYAGNARAVRVVLRSERVVPFMAFFTHSSMTVSAEATAAVIFDGQFCVVALENGNTTGITFSGNTNVNLGCGVMSNSTSSTSVYADGSASVVATPIGGVGGVPQSGAYQGVTRLLPHNSAQADPFANLPTPVVPSPCGAAAQVQPNATRTLSPGCYSGMDLKGTVTFNPGTYIIDGGELAFGATAIASGNGVTFILTSHNAATDPSSIATISMHGNAVLDFSAPTSGTYNGVLMYQDRRAPLADNVINGNSASHFQGGFYFPSGQVTFNGNTGLRTDCIQFVARRFVFSGNSHIQNSCPVAGGGQAFDATRVRLVG